MTAGTFEENTRRVAAGYLRSALLIDDQLTATRSTASESSAVREQPDVDDGLADDLPVVTPPTPEELGEPRTGDVRVIDIVRAFGKQGIACATLEPRGDDPDLVPRLAERVDIVIVDWDIAGEDAGTLALELVARLSNAGGKRVVAIWTQDTDPGKVRDRLAALPDAIRGPSDGGVARIKLPGVNVVVVSKPNAGTSQIPGGVVPVDEARLPEMLVTEFASEAGGLLANAALRGLTAVRDAAPRALAALGADLDAGYLVHRLLLEQPSDAEEQARLIVADEIAGLLEVSGLEREVAMPAIEAWLVSRPYFASGYPNDRWVTVFHDRPADSAARMTAMIERLGTGVPGEEGSGNLEQGALGNLGQLFARSVKAGKASNQHFAHRLSMRARYGSVPRMLSLGTVVEGDGQFLVCVQPACDAVRLAKPATFPFLVLRPCNGDAEADLIIVDGETVRRFAWRLRYGAMVLRRFQPDKNREVVMEKDGTDGPRFRDLDGAAYRWVGELREAHALRLSNDLAAGLSRVGLDESEWLRRLGAKRQGRA